MSGPALSFVIPLYYSAETIGPLVKRIESLVIEGGHEIILVNDGSRDATATVCRQLLKEAQVPIIYVEHARNFGEHNAVLSGWRQAKGAYIVNLDDDGQNPPDEAVRMWAHAKAQELDVVFGHYAVKQHSAWRNAGSWFTNRMTDWALDKPPGFYLSSFRCVAALVAKEAAQNSGPLPYIDGLILQITQRIGSLEVRHDERQAGTSGTTTVDVMKNGVSIMTTAPAVTQAMGASASASGVINGALASFAAADVMSVNAVSAEAGTRADWCLEAMGY